MKNIILIISIIWLLTSCSTDTNWEKDQKISELNTQIESLQQENSKLREENELIKIWWIPWSVQTTPVSSGVTIMDNGFLPEWTTFEESNGVECMKKAYSEYIAAWTKRCQSLGYTDAQIQKDECKLDVAYIKTLQKQKTDAEAVCGPQ
jgi:hypothetical protein